MWRLINAANVFVNFWLLLIVHRQAVRKQLPWFVCYVVWAVLAGSAALVLLLIGRQMYDTLSWWMEIVEIALIVAAVRESFLRLFKGFTTKPGFRWSVWSVIGGVVIYSAWKAIHAPPVEHNKIGVFEIEAEFLFRWTIFGIALLTTILGFLLRESSETREDAVVTGFGLASFGFLVYVMSFWVLGTKYTFLTKFAPSVGYFLAAFWWIWVFSRPVAEYGFEQLGMGPEDIAKMLRRYRDFGNPT